jgi:hypothetical protein
MGHLLGSALLLLSVVACRGGQHAVATESATVGFRSVTVPSTVLPEELNDYLTEHYWDNFDFRDTTQLSQLDTTEMVRAFYAYTRFVNPSTPQPMGRLMERAATSKPMTDYFAMLAERVLHDPNSPARNDELYIPVLEVLTQSPWLDKWERLAPEHDLHQAMQNRVGRPANDFSYTTADGATHRMYSLQAQYTLIFLNNPGCHMCKQVREAICASAQLSDLIDRGVMRVLAIYPDEDLTEWRNYRSQIPATWINGYDKGCTIREGELYDLKAIPALYLLNADKCVMVKDATDVALIEWVIAQDNRQN